MTLLVAVSACAGARASEWHTVRDTSTVTLWATKQGVWFSGVFQEFTARIDFDPSNPAAGSIFGVVRTGTYETENSQDQTYVRSYLDVETYPEARFESASIDATTDGFRASGDLTIAGQTRPAMLDFIFEPTAESAPPANHAKFWGTLTINRFDFGIANDVDIDRAGQDVTVRVALDLER